MLKYISMFLVLMLVACSSGRSKYQVYKKKKGGYLQEKFQDDLSLVSFRGNSYTKKSTAELFAKFRAIELCQEAGKKFAGIVGILDRSESKTVTRTNGAVYGFPSYYYGYSPFYSRYSGIGFGGSFGTMSGSSWNETLTYPSLEVVYRCSDQVFEPEIIMREVGAEEMKHLVKDLKGALQVEKVVEGSPNQKLEVGDIILKAEGKRVEKTWQVMQAFSEKKKALPIEVLRDGERVKMNLMAADVSPKVETSQQEILKSACDFKEIKKRSLCKK